MGEYARSLLVKLPVTVSCVLLEVAVVVAHTHTHTHVHVCAPTDIHLSIGNQQSVLVLFVSFPCLSHSFLVVVVCIRPSILLFPQPHRVFLLFFLPLLLPTTTDLDSVVPFDARLVLKNNAGGGGGGGGGVIMIAAVKANRLRDK